jgi:heat shock protein HtpX
VAALVSVVSLLSDFLMNFSFFGGSSDDEEGLGPFGWIVGLLVAIIAPLIALMIQLAISRRREYLADASGALLTRYPPGLANALRKISQSQPMSHVSAATAHLYIANPFGKGSLTRLFSTHPPAEDRIRRLEEMGGRA